MENKYSSHFIGKCAQTICRECGEAVSYFTSDPDKTMFDLSGVNVHKCSNKSDAQVYLERFSANFNGWKAKGGQYEAPKFVIN
jgi:hypothetical protein